MRARAPRRRAQAPDDAVPSLASIGLDAFEPYLLNRVAARYNAGLAQSLRAVDLSVPKLRALAVLSVEGRKGVSDLAALTVIDPSTLSRTLDAMEAGGLVTRSVSASDGRAREVGVTARGREVFVTFWPIMFGRAEALFADVPADQRAVFLHVLQRMLANIGAAAD